MFQEENTASMIRAEVRTVRKYTVYIGMDQTMEIGQSEPWEEREIELLCVVHKNIHFTMETEKDGHLSLNIDS
jgi:hypothetical protein